MYGVVFGLVISLLSIVVLIYTYYIFKLLNSKKGKLIHFIEFIIYYKVFFYMLVPAILRIFSDFQYDKKINIEYYEIIMSYSFEALSYLVWLSVFYIVVHKFKHNENKISDIFLNNIKHFFILLSLMYLYFIYIKVSNLWFGVEIESLFESTLYVFMPVIEVLGPAVAFYTLINFSYKENKLLYLIVIVVCLLYVFDSFLSGIRHLIVHPAFFILYLMYIQNKKKQIKYLFSILIVFALFQGVFLEFRNISKEDRMEILISSDLKEAHRSLFEEVEWRYGEASRMSVALLRRGSEGKQVGLNVIESALYAPLPRSFFPDKPIPGSSEGDFNSMAMHIVQSDLRGEWWNMSDFYFSAHSYWEFQIIGVIIFSIISSIYIGTLTILLSKIGMLGIPFIFIFFKPFTVNDVKVILFNIPLQITKYIIPLITLYIFFRLIKFFYISLFKLILKRKLYVL